MRTTITINCEDERELLLHLTVIRQQIKSEIKKQKGYLEKDVKLTDNNCYGDHTVNIKNLL